MQDTKRCGGCNTRKSLDEFHKDSSRKDGLSSRCKSCRSRRKFPLDKDKRYKLCTGCVKFKPVTEFWKNGDHYRSKCKACLKRYNANYYDQNSIIINDSTNRYKQIYGRGNISEWARLAACERTGRWRARFFNCQYEKVDLLLVLAKNGMKCHICDSEITCVQELNFDHIISLSKGGAHTYDNIKPAHTVCNWRKH